MNKSPSPPFFNFADPWSSNENSIWLATTISLYRNIEKFNFPPKLLPEKRKQVLDLISKELLNLETLSKPVFMKAEEAKPAEKQFLYEHFLTPYSFHEAYTGEGFILDSTGQFLATINVRNHLQLQLLDLTGEMETTWNRLAKTEMLLGKSMNYAYGAKFGFLTSDPSECGTGLILANFLQVPALIHTDGLSEYLIKHREEAIAISGIQGKPNELVGDIISIRNNYTLGLTEENILTFLRNFTTKLLVKEKACRSHIKEQQNPIIKDKVSRAFGILMYSYRIETVEALNAISLLKLGLELGWVKGATNALLNALFFQCRRAHLLRQYTEEFTQEEIPHKRSEFIHRTLKDIQLMI